MLVGRVWTIGALVVGALGGGLLTHQWLAFAAAQQASSPAGGPQSTGLLQWEARPFRNINPPRTEGAGQYKFSSEAVAKECGEATQIDWEEFGSTGSPNYGLRPFLPVNGKGGEDITGPYEPVLNWPLPLHNDYQFGGQAGIYVESPDRVYVLQRFEVPVPSTPFRKAGGFWGGYMITESVAAPAYRGKRWEHHLLVFDRQGKLIDSWKQHDPLFSEFRDQATRLHVNRYDPERHLWIIYGNKISKFTRDGKLVMTVEGKDPKGGEIGFHGGMAWMPNGDFFAPVTDRVVKFSKDGKFLSEFGRHGSGPGEFGGGTHGIVIDPDTLRIYIGDRPNSRIQVFDQNGKFLDEWPNIMAAYVLRLSKDHHLWVTDALTQKFLKYDLNGKLLASWGTFGTAPGTIWGSHYFDTDSEGNLYHVSDYATGPSAIQKWRPRADGNPAQLVGQLVR